MFYVIQHVREEGPGVFGRLLPKGYKTVIAGEQSFPEVNSVSGLLIMGGPMGVYEKDKYTFIEAELDLIRACAEKGVKIFGVCLGAQMIAEALGGRVYKGHIQETGWYQITLTEEAKKDKIFAHFPTNFEVFQWHGDTFTLPEKAVRLAFSDSYINQAFRVFDNIYGLQFHIEVTWEIIKDWFPHEFQNYRNESLAELNAMAEEAFMKFLAL